MKRWRQLTGWVLAAAIIAGGCGKKTAQAPGGAEKDSTTPPRPVAPTVPEDTPAPKELPKPPLDLPAPPAQPAALGKTDLSKRSAEELEGLAMRAAERNDYRTAVAA
jgi:hypothetical protein